MSEREIRNQFELVTTVASACSCGNDLTDQFHSSRKFASYVDTTRKGFVNSQGWHRATISTAAGLNSTGAFRSIVPVLIDEVYAAGGPRAVLQWKEREVNSHCVRSYPLDSDELREYEERASGDFPVLAMDLYTDSTTLARSGAQSACLIRVRAANVHGRSTAWHDVAIAPHMSHAPALSQGRLSQECAKLFHRFLFKVLEEAIQVSKTGVNIGGELFVIRLLSLVADQPQERQFLGLKAAGSFMDCSLCMIPSITPTMDENDAAIVPPELLIHTAHDSIHDEQLTPSTAHERNVRNTVLLQVLLATEMPGLSNTRSGSRRIYSRTEINAAKQYLRRVSASQWPPALAALHGLGSAPYDLYMCIAFDTLHVMDLGVSRALPDMAFTSFSKSAYKKGVLTKTALVRIVNQRFTDFAAPFGIHDQPFRFHSQEVHANMTGSKRWPALLGLRPSCLPDDEEVLQPALSLDRFQQSWRGMNKSDKEACRKENDISKIEYFAFQSSATMCSAFGLRVSTKFHRLMRHAGDHLCRVGCSRRGETDANETIHKSTKSAYSNTNKRLSLIRPQLLSMRSMPSYVIDDEPDNDVNARAVLSTSFSPNGDQLVTDHEEGESDRNESEGRAVTLPIRTDVEPMTTPREEVCISDLHDVVHAVSNDAVSTAVLGMTAAASS